MPKRNEKESKNFLPLLSRFPKESPQLFWGIAAFVIIFAVFFVSLVPQQIRLQVGDVSPMDVKAPQEVIDDAATERIKAERAKTVLKSYDNDEQVLIDVQSQIAAFRRSISEIDPTATTQEVVQSLRVYLSDDASDADIIATIATSSQTLDLASARLDELMSAVLTLGLRPENVDKTKQDIRNTLDKDNAIPDQLARVLGAFVSKNLRANHTLNEDESDRRLKAALAEVEPVRIRRGQFIVRDGEVVTEDQIAILTKLGMIGSRLRFGSIAGSLIMSVLVCGIVFAYLRIELPDALSPKRIGLVAAVVMLSVLASRGLATMSPLLVPVAGGAMLASTLFDRRFGAFLGCALTLVAGVITGFDIRFLPLGIAGSLAAALSVKNDWNRTHLLKAGFVVSGVQGAVYLVLGLTGGMPLSDLLNWKDSLMVLLNGPLSAILAIGSLPLFEAAFGIITPIRLIELSSPESPLLHRLLLEAPGTYHHSIMVGNLAEAAATAIGADSLLTRVGAYYHDVGKIKRPYFFVENQVTGMDNPHDKMSPTLSASVITSHVKDGLDLAVEHKIPEVLRPFITEHHGTMLASFFYSKAAESQPKDSRVPEEWDFRYEGPRPESKEVAMVMLADGVEAATRAISKPTPARIESVVRKMIRERLLDQQLDRSDLTLRELDTVADTFTRVLSGIFHTRIEYPDRPAKS